MVKNVKIAPSPEWMRERIRNAGMRPINNIAKNIVYAGSKENVRLTMVNGRVLYEDGEFFIGEDAGKIYDEAEKIMETIKR